MAVLLALPPSLQSAEIRAHYVLFTFKFLNYICVSVYVHMALVEVGELDIVLHFDHVSPGGQTPSCQAWWRVPLRT